MGNNSGEGFEMLVWDSGDTNADVIVISEILAPVTRPSGPNLPWLSIHLTRGKPWVISCPLNLWLNFPFCNSLKLSLWWERLKVRVLPGRQTEGREEFHFVYTRKWGSQHCQLMSLWEKIIATKVMTWIVQYLILYLSPGSWFNSFHGLFVTRKTEM